MVELSIEIDVLNFSSDGVSLVSMKVLSVDEIVAAVGSIALGQAGKDGVELTVAASLLVAVGSTVKSKAKFKFT